jgi:hypothetical protein
MKDTDNAFPVLMTHSINDGLQYLESGGMGITLRQYAAIKLRVPRSGDPEIDAMIRESQRADFVKAALSNLMVMGTSSWEADYKDVLAAALKSADAMLAEWEKEAGHG